MKPLIVLLAASLLILVVLKFVRGVYDFTLSARLGMSVMLVFTAMGHFMFSDGMVMMIPDFIPLKKELVYITGIVEIFGAIGLHIDQFRILTAWLLIVFFILILPANIEASIKQLDFQTETFEGNGLAYLWFRVPLQLLFMTWVYLSAIPNYETKK